MLNTKVSLQLYKIVVAGQVKWQRLLTEGKIFGRYNDSPMLNDMIYEVELPDVQVKDYAANIITANMLS